MARRADTPSTRSVRQTSVARCAAAARPGSNHLRRTPNASTTRIAAANFKTMPYRPLLLVRRPSAHGLVRWGSVPRHGRSENADEVLPALENSGATEAWVPARACPRAAQGADPWAGTTREILTRHRRGLGGLTASKRRPIQTRRFGWLAAIAICATAPALAQDAEQRMTVLHLSQTAERIVTRDLLRVELRVEETAADAASVQAAINRRMAAALDRARQVQGIRVETGSYNVGEEHPQNGPSRWRGSQSVILTGKDADSVLKLAGALQSDGLSTSSLRYQTSPETVQAAQDELTAEAIAALDRRATSIAGNMHLTVLRYRDLHVGNAETADRPVPRFA